MKKLLFLALFVSLNFNAVFAHGFGAHVEHLQKIVAMNLPGSYLGLIDQPRYKPYFLYGSIFPDIQYAPSYKSALTDLYQKISEISGVQSCSYIIPMNEIPDINTTPYCFGIDTHDEKYALAFAEYMLQQCAPIDPPGPNPGSNGIDTAHDARNMKLAFAVGYYAHLVEDIACHNFLVPRVTALTDLGDIELIKSPQIFGEDPNAQTEGIIEGIIDHYYGNNYLVADMIYNQIWVSRNQLEPDVPEALLWYYGPGNPVNYVAPTWPAMNPVLLFFHSVLNTWYNTNPFNLPTSPNDSYRKGNVPLSANGLDQLADVFRFANRFYPANIGLPFNGYQRLDQVLADWIGNHLWLEWWAELGDVLVEFFFNLVGNSFRENFFAFFVYPTALAQTTPELANDARAMISLMLADINEADRLANEHAGTKINLDEYNKLKSSILFTNPHSILDQVWNEYEEMGCRIYAEVGPTGSTQNWYYQWSPWRKQTMTWGVYSSLNNLLPEIYESNPNVAVYNSYFEIGGIKVEGPQPYSVFQTYSTARINLDLFNTKDVASQSLNLVVKRDHNSTNYGSDGVVNSTGAFSIDQNPINYGSVNRLTKYLDFPVSVNDLASNKGYYYELKNNASNKPIFSSSFEQYQNRLALTANYYRIYDTYKKWPYSLGVERNVHTITPPQPLVEESFQRGSYLINGLNTSFIQAEEGSYVMFEAIPGNTDEIFFKWSDGNTNNPMQYVVQSSNNIQAKMKKINRSSMSNAFSINSQKKLVKTSDGILHKVYSSMGRVWYEKSTDNGVTWTIENYGQPLSSNESKLPAIDFNSANPTEIIIAWQEKYNETYKIRLAHYSRPGPNFVFHDVYNDAVYYPTTSYSHDAMPVIS